MSNTFIPRSHTLEEGKVRIPDKQEQQEQQQHREARGRRW